MKKMNKFVAGAAVTAMLTFGMGVGAAQAASLPSGFSATCTLEMANGYISGWPQNWNKKKSTDCKGTYRLYKAGKLKVTASPNTRAWVNIRSSYNSAQKWCNQNSLTCAILISAGSFLVSPLLSAARS